MIKILLFVIFLCAVGEGEEFFKIIERVAEVNLINIRIHKPQIFFPEFASDEFRVICNLLK